ncbi:facilitated trehalose transporter Tret1-like [Planococcus citri]|uniref:facilitated trehalose transporter Tret1-like n=1 Tax=Planococcus citri TaxID=170843 RepID=UPI0031F88FBE
MTLSKEAIHQTLAIIPVGFNELAMGLGNGWLAPTLKKLQDTTDEIPLTIEQCSWIGSLHEFGRFFGPLFLALILDKLGRKILLIFCAFVFFAMWLVLLYTKSVTVLYVTRFIFGIGIGICDVTSSIYLGENCSPKYRGIFSSITVISFYVGMLLEFYLATYLSYETVIIINLIVALVGLLSSFFLKETPHFLMLRENFVDAGITLQWLKGSILWNDVHDEFEQIKHNVAEEKSKSSFHELYSTPANYKSITIGFVLNLLIMSTGYATIIAFASLIFPPSTLLSPYGFTIFYGIDQLIAVCVSIFVIERFDRRVLILFAFSMFAIIHACTASLYYFHDAISSSELYPWLIFSTVTAYGSIYTFAYPVIHIIRGELFPQSVRVVGSCLAIMAHSGMGFLSAKTFLMVDTYLGIYTNFIIFSGVSIVGFIYTYFFLPETRGKTLLDIQKLFVK